MELQNQSSERCLLNGRRNTISCLLWVLVSPQYLLHRRYFAVPFRLPGKTASQRSRIATQLLAVVVEAEIASCLTFVNLSLLSLPFVDLKPLAPLLCRKGDIMIGTIVNKDCPYRLLSASARAPPGS